MAFLGPLAGAALPAIARLRANPIPAAVQLVQRAVIVGSAMGVALYGYGWYRGGNPAAAVDVTSPGWSMASPVVPDDTAPVRGRDLGTKVNAILRGTGLAGQGPYMVRLSQQHRIPIELALAMFRKESSLLSAGASVRNNNPGNIVYVAWTRSRWGAYQDGRWAHFPSIQAGIGAYYDLLDGPLYRGFVDRSDWRGLIYQYAPPSENNSDQYVRQITQWMQEYRNRLGIAGPVAPAQ